MEENETEELKASVNAVEFIHGIGESFFVGGFFFPIGKLI